MSRDRSRDLYGRALSVMPGGVNSPVRAVQPYPFVIDHGEGAHVVDVDGNRYIDYVMAYGPTLLGHTLPDQVTEAITEQIAAGPVYGAPTEPELELAEFIVDHVSAVEQIRFVNSGTEATSTAVRLARGYTGRDDIVIVQGGYHGGFDAALVSADGSPSSPGVPDAVTADTTTVPFNDPDTVERLFDRRGTDIAAVMVEPMLGNHGCLHPTEGYLETLREITERHGALLIFDEVMTGFRIGGLECAQGVFGVEPDLTTFAKVIGGGFPVGALGGKTTIMRHLSPEGDVFHASTYAGHPVGMVAGLETLRYAKENDVYGTLADLGDRLRAGLSDLIEDHRPAYTVVGRDSMFKVIFTRGGAPGPTEGCRSGCRQDPACDRYDMCPKSGSDVDEADGERWRRLFWQSMLNEGVFLTANQNESQFLSAAHTREDIDETLEAYKAAL